jgi:hypothetical protein
MSPCNIKEVHKEYNKNRAFIITMIEAKKYEYVKKYQAVMGTYVDDNNYFNGLSFSEKDSIIKKLEAIKKNDSKKL